MPAGNQDISWQNIAAAAALVGLMVSAQWVVTQTEFTNVNKITDEIRGDLIRQQHDYAARDETDDLKARVTILEQDLKNLIARVPHDPVDQKTADATNSAVAKEIDQIQSQITDINRQIAAALIIIDNNNSGVRKNSPLPP